MKFRKKPVVIEAHQWFKNGDHPEDNVFRPFEDTGKVPTEPREGAVVRYFRHPRVPGNDYCAYCKRFFHDHGWIDTLEGGQNVCPGDFIITGIAGERYPCKPAIFAATYESEDAAERRLEDIRRDCDCPTDACATIRGRFHLALKDMQDANDARRELRIAAKEAFELISWNELYDDEIKRGEKLRPVIFGAGA